VTLRARAHGNGEPPPNGDDDAPPNGNGNAPPNGNGAEHMDDDSLGSNVDRLVRAANRLARTIAATEELTQRRAELLRDSGIRVGEPGAVRQAQIVSLSEAARRTGRNPEVIRRWCIDGRIRAIRVGRTWAIPADSLQELIAHSARSRPRFRPTPPA
jgi:excisionase family DNA binding protein